ncbi:MAG: hypothetical protein N2234_10285 [Planctomycetota bacterium]|nr:hypothetical protein [Planctomycetota bacterium]
MLDKFKQKEKEFMGMSKGEFVRLCAMLILMLLVLISLIAVLPTYMSKPQERKKTPEGMRVDIPPKTPERIDDSEESKKYMKWLNEKFGGKGGSGETSSDILPPKPPSPKEAFKENPEMWNKVVDNSDYLPDDVQVYVLHMLNSMSAEEIEKKAEEIHLRTAVTNPKEYRGKFVHVRGRLISLENRTLNDNVSGITQFWLGKLYRTENPSSVLFIIFEKDREFEADPYMGDDVELSGVFVMMLETVYEEKGKEVRRIEPFLIARRLVYLPPHSMMADFPWTAMLIVSGVILALVVFLIIKARLELKESEKFLQNMRNKLLAVAKTKSQNATGTEERKPSECSAPEKPPASPQEVPPLSCSSPPVESVEKKEETEKNPTDSPKKEEPL